MKSSYKSEQFLLPWFITSLGKGYGQGLWQPIYKAPHWVEFTVDTILQLDINVKDPGRSGFPVIISMLKNNKHQVSSEVFSGTLLCQCLENSQRSDWLTGDWLRRGEDPTQCGLKALGLLLVIEQRSWEPISWSPFPVGTLVAFKTVSL